MLILIVASNANLSKIWARHLRRHGEDVIVLQRQSEAIAYLRGGKAEVIVLDLMLEDGSAFAIADFASYRQPDARIVFVTRSTFFSDGSLFTHIPNTAAVLQEQTPPNDLAAIVSYHGRSG
ncbi:response regulator [Rhodobacteraceae bacterium]|nr:response regulator [Paracoccaceae bacterium]